jgi:hypothetical protein
LRGGAEGQREQIAKEILNYFLRNPAAADTFEGIVRWRITEEIARRTVASTEDAVQWLIAEGFLCEEKIAGGRTLLKLDAKKKKDAELLVKETKPKQRRPSGRSKKI